MNEDNPLPALMRITPEQLLAYFVSRERRTSDAAKKLYARGWFLSMDMTIDEPSNIASLLPDEADAYLIDHYSQRLDALDIAICAAYPNRVEPISQAFEAVRLGLYFLSVPVMLSQSEAIAREAMDYPMFTGNRHQRASAANSVLGDPKDFSDLREEFDAIGPLDAYLAPLRDDNPINSATRGNEVMGEHLRRHSIMHGYDFKYGSELNALKAVSLLSYMATVVTLAARPSGKTPNT